MKNTMKKPVVISIEKLHPFDGHPFKVKDDDEMNTLIESIQTQGILSPLIVRPIEDTDKYEVISGHRRLHAAIKAGIAEVPALIYALDRDAAAIAVVDSNLHREHILPSEKAFAYRMKLEAMSRQGHRSDLTSDQLGRKLETAEIIAQQSDDSKSQVRRIGVYLYKGRETPGGMPRILDDDLFYRVQSMMNKNKNAPARTHGEGEYLLTTKLFCRHCKEMMVGYGGTSKTGRQYHYYMCKNARRKKCGKKIVSKSYIEDRVVNECLKMLTEEKIRFIAKKVAEECAKSPDNLTAKALKKAIREANTAIENLWKAIEQGQAVEMLTDRLHKRMAEKAELEAQLAIEENKKITLTEAQILAFLDYVCEMPADDVNKRRAIINIFVHSIYLYDDHFTLIINASKKPLSIDNIPLDDIESVFEGSGGASEGCSSLSTPAPP